MTSHRASDSKALLALLVQANEHRRREDYKAAIALYHEAVRQYGENEDILAAIASGHFNLAARNPVETGTNYHAAIAAMERAISLAPNSARLHASLGEYYALGVLDYERAARAYRRAAELNPYDLSALIGAAGLYGLPEKVVTLDEAIGWLERAAQLEPQDPNVLFRLGALYREAGRFSDTRRAWLKALQCPRPLDPSPARTVEVTLTAGGDGFPAGS